LPKKFFFSFSEDEALYPHLKEIVEDAITNKNYLLPETLAEDLVRFLFTIGFQHKQGGQRRHTLVHLKSVFLGPTLPPEIFLCSTISL
jgi:hypothetical protein